MKEENNHSIAEHVQREQSGATGKNESIAGYGQ